MTDETLNTSSTDALHWAEHFCRTLAKINKAKGQPTQIDVDWVQGWFANYWAAVGDPLHKRIEELEANSAFFKCCSLSGETPKEGSEPYPQKGEKVDDR